MQVGLGLLLPLPGFRDALLEMSHETHHVLHHALLARGPHLELHRHPRSHIFQMSENFGLLLLDPAVERAEPIFGTLPHFVTLVAPGLALLCQSSPQRVEAALHVTHEAIVLFGSLGHLLSQEFLMLAQCGQQRLRLSGCVSKAILVLLHYGRIQGRDGFTHFGRSRSELAFVISKILLPCSFALSNGVHELLAKVLELVEIQLGFSVRLRPHRHQAVQDLFVPLVIQLC
mmetsp:Transcript_128671/g.181471  ORF Transcript_128671/g.181471 Transcript_128671/m.181471 type:complete len:230 (-) Transcript_128671:258-947(-)